MVKITKVYTRQGDTGQTHLGGGERIAKNSARIQAIGDVDELNAYVGFAATALRQASLFRWLEHKCLRIQNELFNLGSQLAVLPENRRIDTPVIEDLQVKLLEQDIDQCNAKLDPLKSFVLPGGGEIVTRMHLARTVCRRAERSVLSLSAQDANLDGSEAPYLNRLSDWFFVMGRYSGSLLKEEELLWSQT